MAMLSTTNADSTSLLVEALGDANVDSIRLMKSGSPYHVGTLYLRRRVSLFADNLDDVVVVGHLVLTAEATLRNLELKSAGAHPTVHVKHLVSMVSVPIITCCVVRGTGNAPALRLDATANVTRCHIDGAGDVGVLVVAGGATRIESCTVSGSTTGVELRGTSTECEISANMIIDSHRSGVACTSGTLATVSGNAILRSGKAGIEASGGARPRVLANIVADGRGVGLLVHGGGAGEFCENDVRRNQSSAAELNGAGDGISPRGHAIYRAHPRTDISVYPRGGLTHVWRPHRRHLRTSARQQVCRRPGRRWCPSA